MPAITPDKFIENTRRSVRKMTLRGLANELKLAVIYLEDGGLLTAKIKVQIVAEELEHRAARTPKRGKVAA